MSEIRVPPAIGTHVPYQQLPALAKTFVDSKSSRDTQVVYTSMLADFFGFLAKDPGDVTIFDWDRFAAYLNARISPKTHRSIGGNTKLTIHGCIRGFYKFAAPRLQRAGHPVVQIPSFEYSGLSGRVEPEGEGEDDDSEDGEDDARLLTRAQMDGILAAARAHGYDKYLLFLLKKHTGMRGKEITSILIKNVNLKERWIKITPAKKRGKQKHAWFYIPKVLAEEMRLYLINVEATYPGNKWLFPTPRGHYSRFSLLKLVEKIRQETGIYFCAHWFRHAITTYRINEMDCPEDVARQLINHKSGTPLDAYNLRQLQAMWGKYDHYHPYNSL